MKNLVFGVIATIFMSNYSIGQNKMTINSAVTTEEYKSLDSNEQRLTDYISSAIASLNALELNGQKYPNYNANVFFSKNEKDALKNGFILSPENSNITIKGSCKVCGMSSAISCIKKISAAFEGVVDYEIHVHNDGNGCVTLSW